MAYNAINRGAFLDDPDRDIGFDAWEKVNGNFEELYNDKVVNVLDFGTVRGDNTFDNGQIIEQAFNSLDSIGSHIIIPKGDYYVSQDIIVPPLEHVNIDFKGRLFLNGNKLVFTYLKYANISGISIINENKDYTDDSIAGVEFNGLLKSKVDFKYLDGFTNNIWFNPKQHPITPDGKAEPISYNSFTGNTIWNSKNNILVTLGDKDTVGGYFTENSFGQIDIRQSSSVYEDNSFECTGMKINQTPNAWTVNNIRFNGTTFELQNVAIDGNMNFSLFANCRFEVVDINYRGYCSRLELLGGYGANDLDKYELSDNSKLITFFGAKDLNSESQQAYSANQGGFRFLNLPTLNEVSRFSYSTPVNSLIETKNTGLNQIYNKQFEANLNNPNGAYRFNIPDGNYREGSVFWNNGSTNVLGCRITQSGTAYSGSNSITLSGTQGDSFVTIEGYDPDASPNVIDEVTVLRDGCHLSITGVYHGEVKSVNRKTGVISFFNDTLSQDLTNEPLGFFGIETAGFGIKDSKQAESLDPQNASVADIVNALKEANLMA